MELLFIEPRGWGTGESGGVDAMYNIFLARRGLGNGTTSSLDDAVSIAVIAGFVSIYLFWQ